MQYKPLLMVGSVPCETEEEVFGLLGPGIGDLLIGLSDGEPGYRNKWIVFNAPHVFEPHPDVEVTNRPLARPDNSVFKDVPNWVPTSWEDMWRFRIRDGVEKIRFETLHYAEFAKKSYAVFRNLRDKGAIPAGTRFQVNFPFPEDFTRWCTGTPRDFRIMTDAVLETLQREVKSVLETIPHQDLNIQWDVCWEVFACDTGDSMGREPLAWKAGGDPYERFAAYIRALSPLVPADVVLGMHLCYGDLEHSHLVEPKDLGVAVRMANIASSASPRPLDYVQMPVPRDRTDDAYFAPLKDFDGSRTRLYIGLVHFTDGVEGTLKRVESFRRHYKGEFGIATECGWGRRQRDTIPALMEIHRKVAESLPN